MFCEALVILSFSAMAASDFPKGKDMTKVAWAHGVNNQSILHYALNSKVHMLEADVSVGRLNGMMMTDDEPNDMIPIMAHPPNTISDLSLRDFLWIVNGYNMNHSKTQKGVKLDFKSIQAFNAAVIVLRDSLRDLHPVWLNADILRGPVNSTTIPVDARQFITMSNTEFSNDVVLSLGWTTYYEPHFTGYGYTPDQINEMIRTIHSMEINKRITFPVRAVLAAESYQEMKNLIKNVSGSTLTIWASENDPVNVKKLKTLIMDIGLDKVFLDVPNSLRNKLGLPASGNRLDGFGIFTFILTTSIILYINSNL